MALDNFNIETKEDSAAKLAEAAGKETKFYLFAAEFNSIGAYLNAVKTHVNGLIDNLAGKVDKETGKSLLSDTEIARLLSMTAIFTTTLKTAYDGAVSNSHTHANKAILDAITEAFTTTLLTKLNGIASGATANSSDATLLNRSNHTGTQLASTISDFTAAVNALISGKVDKETGKSLLSDTEIARLLSMTAIFTTTLKTAYDGAVSNSHTHANKAILDAITEAFTTTLLTKLNGIAAGATANSSDATLLNRSNHTGTQLASTISDFASAVNALISGKVDKETGKSLLSDTEIARLLSMTAIFTTTLKTAYDGAVTNSHTHTNKTILDAITEAFTTTLLTKLNGIAAGATANSSDATLLNRTNHTGTQLSSTISDFTAAVNALLTSYLTISSAASTYQTLSAATTGSAISFVVPQIYNSPSSPSSANITNNLTGAAIGVIQKIYHNNGSAPTFPAGWVKIGSGSYVNSTLNIIFAEWISGTRVEYWIVQ